MYCNEQAIADRPYSKVIRTKQGRMSSKFGFDSTKELYRGFRVRY